MFDRVLNTPLKVAAFCNHLKKPSLPLILLKKDSTSVALSGLLWFYENNYFVEYLLLVTMSAKPIVAATQTSIGIVTL